MAVYTDSEGALQLRSTEFAMPTDNAEIAQVSRASNCARLNVTYVLMVAMVVLL